MKIIILLITIIFLSANFIAQPDKPVLDNSLIKTNKELLEDYKLKVDSLNTIAIKRMSDNNKALIEEAKHIISLNNEDNGFLIDFIAVLLGIIVLVMPIIYYNRLKNYKVHLEQSLRNSNERITEIANSINNQILVNEKREDDRTAKLNIHLQDTKLFQPQFEKLIQDHKYMEKRIREGRIAFIKLHEDIIHFCLHVSYTSGLDNDPFNEVKLLYYNNFHEHSGYIGLYSDNYNVLYGSLQKACVNKIIPNIMLIHLNYIEHEIKNNGYEFTHAMNKDLISLIDIIRGRYKTQVIGF